ncbi:MAG: hypothetical protein A2X12_10235 [Bacteroidetes bacterium GWE2_29_8]|nr:MAG: hypothetical protein A2X12_10235 [Bacteroidetes bacterium GWE2_29_8]OFY19000.1 MAG: hypothetical protein A2X02_03420 [Bacteroidetes bacterium GWF2_29_10]
MIKINNIEINNYRSCIKTKFDVHPNLTTLIGINGSGKSNILNSLQLLKRVNYDKFITKEDIKSHSSLTLALSFGNINLTIKADFYFENDNQILSGEIKYKKEGSKKWEDIDLDLYVVVEREKRRGLLNYGAINNRKRIGLNDNVKISFSENKKEQFQFELVQILSNISYYSATQFSDPTECPSVITLDDFKLTNANNKTKPHGKFIYDLHHAYCYDKSSFNKFITTVNKEGIGLIDDIVFLATHIPNSKGKDIQTQNDTIIPRFIIDSKDFSPNQLSEGTFKTLALLFYIINDVSELLLIEEPEVCIHHGLLDSIIELIKVQSKKKQIIISTHSDYVLDKLKPENVVLVSRDTDKGTIAKPLSKALSKNDYAALKSYLQDEGNLGEYWKLSEFEND